MLTLQQNTKETKISPYQYVSELIDEQIDDEAIKYIRELCLDFVMYPGEFPELYKPGDVFMSYKFIQEKLKELSNFKESLGLSTVYSPFTHIGHGLDMITVQDSLDSFTSRSVFYEVSLQIDMLLDSLSFYEKILEKIIYTRKER